MLATNGGHHCYHIIICIASVSNWGTFEQWNMQKVHRLDTNLIAVSFYNIISVVLATLDCTATFRMLCVCVSSQCLPVSLK